MFVRLQPLASPLKGVKATELFVTIDANTSEPNIEGEQFPQMTLHKLKTNPKHREGHLISREHDDKEPRSCFKEVVFNSQV